MMAHKGWVAAAAMLVALVTLAPCGSRAATESNFDAKTTADIVALCDPLSNTTMDIAGINFCQGFAEGAVLVEQQHEASPHARRFFCLPDPAPSRNDAIAGFVKWAKASPDRMSMGAVDGLMTFLGDAYPCPKHR
jgi:hypothetical protein